MTAPSKSRWRGVPADERQAERRAILVEAGFELLGSAGLAGTTVRGVCETARLNPRYFYESFEDLDALLVAVFERTAVEALEVMMAAGETVVDDPLESMKAGIGAFIEHVTDDRRRVQVLFIEGMGNEALSRRRLRSMIELADLLSTATRELGGVVEDDPIFGRAAHLMVGGMAELLNMWLQGEQDSPLELLIDDIAHLFLAVGDEARRIAATRLPPARPARPARPVRKKAAAKRAH